MNRFASLRSLVPAFYGGNATLELLVLEDLGDVRGEDDLGAILEGEDPARARDALLAHARNMAYAGEKTRFYDFEMGAFRHIFLSAAYFRISHLSCFNGSLIPIALQVEAEQAYFQAVAPLIPDPAHYQIDMAAAATAMLVWMLSTTLEKALQQDRPRHLATFRQRIFAAMTLYSHHETFSASFSETAEIIDALREKLDDQWAEEEKTMPIFRAFGKQAG